MDPTTIFLPGAQSLVTAILTDGWKQMRETLARRWSKRGEISKELAEQRLETGREQSLVVAGDGEDRQTRMEIYWAGYLAGLAATQGEFLDVIREFAHSNVQAPKPTVHNSNTGTVGTLLQLGSAQGDITIGGQ